MPACICYGLLSTPCLTHPAPSPVCPAAAGSVPASFEAELGKYTREGLRVLGLATRQLAGLSEGEVQGMAQVGVCMEAALLLLLLIHEWQSLSRHACAFAS